ncbi:hypothetical protein, partial [Enterobacter sichuanensis]
MAKGRRTDKRTPTGTAKPKPASTVKNNNNNGLLGEVTAKADRAGNTSADSDDFVLTLDYTAPDASKLAITEVYDDVNT